MNILYNKNNEKDKVYNMQMIKCFMLLLIFISSSLIGRFIAKKYTYRLEELEEMKNVLNIFKSKIRFTYEPIPEIFREIGKQTKQNIGEIFEKAGTYMQNFSAGEAWEKAVQTSQTNLTNEDIHVLLMLSKMLGQTDIEGQISQIEITENFLEKQIKEAQQEKNKNEKLYRKLGTTIGLVIIIILI